MWIQCPGTSTSTTAASTRLTSTHGAYSRTWPRKRRHTARKRELPRRGVRSNISPRVSPAPSRPASVSTERPGTPRSTNTLAYPARSPSATDARSRIPTHEGPRRRHVRRSTGMLTAAPAVRKPKVCLRSPPRRRSATASGTMPHVQSGISAPMIEPSSIVPGFFPVMNRAMSRSETNSSMSAPMNRAIRKRGTTSSAESPKTRSMDGTTVAAFTGSFYLLRSSLTRGAGSDRFGGMALHDPLFHPLFLGRRAAPETPPFDPFPPSGRKPWKGEPKPRRDLEFHVNHYKVTLEVDLEKRELMGRAILTIEAIRDGLREVALDAAELSVTRVAVKGKRVRHESAGEKLIVTLPKPLGTGKRTTIDITYSTRPRKGFFFVGPTEAETDRHAAGWSQGQADDTHWWIPCLESTESRATLEMIATVPQGYRAIGNGKLVSRRVSAGRRSVTYHWRQETTHPAYLISLVVGKFVELKDSA